MISIFVMKIPTLNAKQSRYCNCTASEWQILGSFPPLLAEINETFYYCHLFLSSLFGGGIRAVKSLSLSRKGTGVQEFENYYFVWMYKMDFSFSLL